MRSSRLAQYSLLAHAVLALAGAAFDITAIAKYATISDDWRLAVTATSIAAVLFAAGCILQAVLTYRHTNSWAAALRSFLQIELAYQAVSELLKSYKHANTTIAARPASAPAQQQQALPSREQATAASTSERLRCLELAGQAQATGLGIYPEDSAFELHGPAARPAVQPAWTSPFAAAAGLPAAIAEHPDGPQVQQGLDSLQQLGEVPQERPAVPVNPERLPSVGGDSAYSLLPAGSLSKQKSQSWLAAKHAPGSQVIRMLKLVHFGVNLPQACLALIVYVQVWQAGTEPVNDVLIVTIVLGIAGCAAIATEYFRYAEWSLWRDDNVPILPAVRLASKHLLTRATMSVVLKRVVLYLLYFFTASVSIAARLILFMFVSVVVKLVDRQKYVNVLMTAAVMLVWWLVCSMIYYSASKQLVRSIKCGYLTMAMSVPFNPAAGGDSEGASVAGSCCTVFRGWWCSLCITLVTSVATTVLGVLQSTLCLLSRHDSIMYTEFGVCNYDEYQMGQALAILGAADGFLFCVACGLRAYQKY